ncbi:MULTISPECIES: SDR family oxidoreductase [Sorangium]|uniref:3-oxoacyl-ACP reductase n=1 Tax=Sorangium cellulosum TaxID=56 RepID=A0A4P2QVM3_SORCE|nr:MULTISPECIES: SDR family oxidoreductase [Sorangium]AUX34151.1 3-oxoacyl-ACP reductase [Sorangium cellulosum]WCQ93462.1 FabG-like 3-oxoacyl-(acyl-carrier-protein) reductase [Sorangium sp. Soce836]
MQAQDLLEHVRSVFVRMTRYPDEVVVPDADLEQDLGIDSVKRGEILATLRADFGLSDALKATPDELRTVARVSDFLSRTLTARSDVAPWADVAGGGWHANGHAEPAGQVGGHAEPAGQVGGHAEPARHANGHAEPAGRASGHAAPASGPAASNGAASAAAAAGEALRAVVEALADATRHPAELLVPDARLEEDLGIDRRRRDEVRALLRQRGALPDGLAGALDEARTVGDLARLLGAPPPAQAAAARAPAAPAAQRATPAPGASLAGKTILVTGSSRGLGRAIAAKLGRAGARVVVNSFHSRDDGDAVADEIRGAGGDAVHVWGSVANPAHVDKLFEAIARDVGELHHFVSNASNGRFGPLEQTTPEHWELAFRTNVIGYHQCALRAARLMERHGGGRIVALSSNGSSRYLEHFGAMGAVKAAVESLTRALAVELAPRNVQVNCVSAGPIYGHVTSNYPDHERILPYWESRTPGGRLCTEEDVADAVLLLLSDGARMINGATLTVDGGGSLCI